MSRNSKVQKQSVRNKNLAVRSIIFLTFSIISIFAIIRANYTTQEKLKMMDQITGYADDLKTASQFFTIEVRAYAATGDKIYSDSYWNEDNTGKSLENAIAALKETGLTDEETKLLDEIAVLSDSLEPIEENAMAAVEANDLTKAVSLVYSDEYDSIADKISEDTETLRTAVHTRLEYETGVLAVFNFVIECIGLILLIFTMYTQFKYMAFVRKELLEPVELIRIQMMEMAKGNLSAQFLLEENESEIGMLTASIQSTKKYLQGVIGDLNHILEMLSGGDFTFKAQADYIGEFETVRAALESFRTRMRETFDMIQTASSQVAGGAEQMATASLDLAEGSTREAAAANSLMSSIKEMEKGIKDTAAQSDEAKRLSSEAGEQLQHGRQKMNELSDAMTLIRTCSEQIVSITATINDIATETNLLSLNASIEAARAGEAGRGFAVVADQVKTLSNDSADAVGKTDELVKRTMEAVEKGIILVEETLSALDQVGGLSADSINAMQNVAAANRMQADKVEDVMQNVNEISDSVQNNSAAAEETAAASEEQNAQSDKLNVLLTQFKL